ncbi:ornithine carbamoyltransferase [bacterium]|nr:ornithine carbamoyltransferase [bacterium]
MKKDFVSIDDFTPTQLHDLILLAGWLKSVRKSARDIRPLAGRSMAMIFEKPSLRTRVTFELAMVELGGHALEGQPPGVRLGGRESVPDLARNLERWVDIVVARVYKNATVRELAANMRLPLINGLCDMEHPCQAVADIQTVCELAGPRFPHVRLAFIGDGNNVCNSLLLICGALGLDLAVANPPGYAPRECFVARARTLCAASGGRLTVCHDPAEAVRGADFIYTDVWTSMGQEAEKQNREQAFRSFQVNAQLLSLAAKEHYVLHCLPAHRGEEITDEVIDGPHSRVFDQAENRLHAQKAVILSLMDPALAERLVREAGK